MSKQAQLPDLVIDRKLLDSIAYRAATNAVIMKLPLTHAEIQAFIHIKALENILLEYGIQPNFEIKL